MSQISSLNIARKEMLRAETCLNLYFGIDTNGSCTYRAEELSQHTCLPFKSENRKAITNLIKSFGLFLTTTWAALQLQPRPVGSTKPSLSCTMPTGTHIPTFAL